MNTALTFADTRRTDQTAFRLVLVALFMVPLLSFWYSQLRVPQPAVLGVLPVAPKAGDPVLATLRLTNDTPAEDTSRLSFYADGNLLVSGTSRLPAGTAKAFQLARVQPLEIGQQASFAMRVDSDQGAVEEARALPGYTPLALSSFVSFASAATAMMSSSSSASLASSSSSAAAASAVFSMAYYREAFDSRTMDVGLVVIMALLGLSLLAEATDVAPRQVGPTLARVRALTDRFRIVMISLYIVYGGIAITKLAVLFRAIG
jgi:hypothetical protein